MDYKQVLICFKNYFRKMSKKTSLINLVDLAGSERVSKTGVGDNKDRLK